MITQKFSKKTRIKPNGELEFMGNYYDNEDSNDPTNRLNGTTSNISITFPFAPMVSDILPVWLNKLERKRKFFEGESLFSNNRNDNQLAIQAVPAIQRAYKKAMDEAINDGNFGELVAYHLMRYGDISDLDRTVELEKLKDPLFDAVETPRAIEFGKLAFEQMMKLGEQVALYDYQTPASDTNLRDATYFDFVLEVDGELVLIDMKSGSNIKGAKLAKTKEQLLGSYQKKFEGVFGKRPHRTYIIASIQDEIPLTKDIKRWKTFGKTIDITNDDPDGKWVELYEAASHLAMLQRKYKITTMDKDSNKISIF